MANASQVASAGVYVTDDIGLEVTDGSNSRVQLGLLPTGTYGLRVIAANGSTVIIDGTSDIFKISATGTSSVTEATGNNSATNDTTLTGLGTFTSTQAGNVFVSPTTAATGLKAFIETGQVTQTTVFVASTSGGSPTTRQMNLTLLAWGATLLNGSSQEVVRLVLINNTGGTWTEQGRYYVFSEVAM